jgi:glyoxylase-like metal-dependent hydrolase (beta-lactamase superfamily II)
LFAFTKGKIKLIRGGSYPHCHSVFIDDRIRGIIDPGSDRYTIQAINNERSVDLLICSHAHEDHILYNYLLSKAKLMVHSSEAEKYEDILKFINGFADTDSNKEEREKWIRFLIEICHFQPRKADVLLTDGEIISFGDVQMKVIHTPGHTKGHCSFYFLKEKVLFTADLDLVKGGPWYAGQNSSIYQTIRSLERLKTFPAETYLTSHGRGIYHGDPNLIDKYLNVIFERENLIIESLKKSSKTLEELTEEKIIYGDKSVVGLWDLADSERKMIKKHLDHLLECGSIRMDESKKKFCIKYH